MPNGQRHLASGISAVSKNALDERKQSPRLTQQVESTITVLNFGGMRRHSGAGMRRSEKREPERNDLLCKWPQINSAGLLPHLEASMLLQSGTTSRICVDCRARGSLPFILSHCRCFSAPNTATFRKRSPTCDEDLERGQRPDPAGSGHTGGNDQRSAQRLYRARRDYQIYD
jgi:hypothetical protein